MGEVAIRDDESAFALVRDLERSGALTATSLDLSERPDLDYEQLESLVAYWGYVHNTSRWALFDTLRAIEMRHGDLVAQAATLTGLAPSTIENGMSIVNKVPKSRRRAGVHFSIHAEVTALAPNDQRRWLKTAEMEGLSRDELRARIKAEKDGHPDVLDAREVCPTCHRPMP
jgi:hypothetical protein